MEQVIMYKNIDGVIFERRDECAKSEGLVLCKICSGLGYEKYEHVETIPYPSNLPDSGWVEDKKIISKKNRECSRCSGLGYVTSNIEDEKDYQQYLELKKRFEKI